MRPTRSPLPPRRLLAVVLAALVLAATGCSGLEGTEGKDYVGGDGQVLEFTPDERGKPVEASGTTVDGDPIDVASYRGQVLVVNVWASWCGPCRKEMPDLVEASSELGAGATLIGINIRDNSAADAAAFERDKGVTFPSFYDQGGVTLLDFTDKIGPRSIPSTMVLDPQGRLAALVLGPLPSKQTLLSVVQKVQQEAAGGASGSADG